MNYSKIYDSIIERALSRDNSSLEYKEVHHIVPKCIGGSNEKSNLVTLTLREHFLAHWLLHKIHPSNLKLLCAWNSFCMHKEDRPTSHLYEYARKKFISAMRDLRYTDPEKFERKVKSNVGKVWMNNGKRSIRVQSDEIEKKKLEGYFIGRITFKRINNPEQYEKAKITRTKTYESPEWESPHKGKVLERKFLCEYCNKSFTKGNFVQWHGELCLNNPDRGIDGRTKKSDLDIILSGYKRTLKDTIWVHNGSESKRVPKEAFEIHMKDKGWFIGHLNRKVKK